MGFILVQLFRNFFQRRPHPPGGGQACAQVRIIGYPLVSVEPEQSNAVQALSTIENDRLEFDMALASEILGGYPGRLSIESQSEDGAQVTILLKAAGV